MTVFADLRAAEFPIYAEAHGDVVGVFNIPPAVLVVTTGTWTAKVRKDPRATTVAATFTVTTDAGANSVTITLPQAVAELLPPAGADRYTGHYSLYHSTLKRPIIKGPIVLEQDVSR